MHWKIVLLLAVIILVFLPSCDNQQSDLIKRPVGSFLGLKPTNSAVLLYPGLISINFTEYNGTFSPSGDEFFYTSDIPGRASIVHMKMNDEGQWSDPKIASFSGNFVEYDPVFSPNGDRLYFSSTRPTSNSDQDYQSNVWYVDRINEGWSEPIYVPLTKRRRLFSVR